MCKCQTTRHPAQHRPTHSRSRRRKRKQSSRSQRMHHGLWCRFAQMTALTCNILSSPHPARHWHCSSTPPFDTIIIVQPARDAKAAASGGSTPGLGQAFGGLSPVAPATTPQTTRCTGNKQSELLHGHFGDAQRGRRSAVRALPWPRACPGTRTVVRFEPALAPKLTCAHWRSTVPRRRPHLPTPDHLVVQRFNLRVTSAESVVQ